MENITISNLFIYPIKSSKENLVDSINVLKTGFEFDRYFAIINSEDKIITARENPKLLHISSKITNDKLILIHPEHENLVIDLNKNTNATSSKITIFKEDTFGKFINNDADIWFSNILDEPCRLIKIDNQRLRNVESKEHDHKIAFTDAYPIHIVTTASINELNSKLETVITDNRFRPNILISGTKPFEEENWKHVTIGNCEFDVVIPTQRCSFITINPSTLIKNEQQEPLRTLAKNKRGYKKVNFGIYLVPKNTGVIYKTDSIKVTV